MKSPSRFASPCGPFSSTQLSNVGVPQVRSWAATFFSLSALSLESLKHFQGSKIPTLCSQMSVSSLDLSSEQCLRMLGQAVFMMFMKTRLFFNTDHLALPREKLSFHGFIAPLFQSRNCKDDYPDRPHKIPCSCRALTHNRLYHYTMIDSTL